MSQPELTSHTPESEIKYQPGSPEFYLPQGLGPNVVYRPDYKFVEAKSPTEEGKEWTAVIQDTQTGELVETDLGRLMRLQSKLGNERAVDFLHSLGESSETEVQPTIENFAEDAGEVAVEQVVEPVEGPLEVALKDVKYVARLLQDDTELSAGPGMNSTMFILASLRMIEELRGVVPVETTDFHARLDTAQAMLEESQRTHTLNTTTKSTVRQITERIRH